MSTISALGNSLPVPAAYPPGATPVTIPARPDTLPATDAAPTTSTVLQLDGLPSVSVVYGHPAAPTAPPRSWAQPAGDAISTLMGRNLDSTASLASQWRGLGAALLERLTQQPGDYRQTLAAHGPGVTDTVALTAVGDQASSLRLQVRTRSGATVELAISVNRGNKDVQAGLQVQARSSGALSDAERKALIALSDGLERAMAGLGRADGPALGVAGLLAYDQEQLSALELSVTNPRKGDPLRSFNLQLGPQDLRLQLQGLQGTLSLRVDRSPLLEGTGTQQRDATITQYLAQFDAAALRSRADADFVAQFKQAFTQLHQASSWASAGPWPPAATAPARLQVAPLLSGLADFDASFDGTFVRTNPYGFVVERSTVQYQSSQQTSVESQRQGPGNLRVTQTHHATLQARILRSLGETELDLSGGNYDLSTIDDAGSRSTTITLHDEKLVQAVEQQTQRQLLKQTRLLRHRPVEVHETPERWQSTRDLLRPSLPPVVLGASSAMPPQRVATASMA